MAASTLERLENVEKAVEQLQKQSAAIVQAVMSQSNSLEANSAQVMSLNRSIISLGKTMTAMVKELSANGQINEDSVMARIRSMEDDNQKAEIEAMLKEKLIKEDESVTENSLVIVSQDLLDMSTGKVTTVAEYMKIEMPSPYVNQSVKADLLGKKKGDRIEVNASETEKYIVTVKKVYTVAEGERAGEVEIPQPDSEPVKSE